MASTAVFNGALSASPGFVLMRFFLLDLVALSNHHADVFNGGGGGGGGLCLLNGTCFNGVRTVLMEPLSATNV